MFVQFYMITFWALLPGGCGLQEPCYECQIFRETQQNSHPYTEIRTHCRYPCNCETPSQCEEGVPLIRDGCGCCWQCARQEGEPCDGEVLCDASKGLACVYEKTSDYQGKCIVMEALKCSVNNQSFHDGETFLLDCRTQCTCKNGTYACVSLCPGESIPPSPLCKDPHLTAVVGQCCREWMCSSSSDVSPEVCNPSAGEWSECSAKPCGLGTSVRWYLNTSICLVKNETRLCQVRPCNHLSPQDEAFVKEMVRGSHHHHLRRSHSCKATQRYPQPVRLKVKGCVTDRKYRPKLCASCSNKCCKVQSSTTIPVDFICPLHAVPNLLRDPPEYPDTKKSSINIFEIMDEGQPSEEDSRFTGLFDSKDHATPNRGGESLSGILAEDLVVHEEDEGDYWMIKNDSHETVKKQIEWIVRCRCFDSCSDETKS